MSKLIKHLVELNSKEIGNSNLVNIKLIETGTDGYVRAKIGSSVWKKFVEDNFIDELFQHGDLFSLKHNLNRAIRCANERAIKIAGVGEKHLRALQFVTDQYDNEDADTVKLKFGSLTMSADIDSLVVLTSREYEVCIRFLDEDGDENVVNFDKLEVVKTIETPFKINGYTGEYDPTTRQWAFGCADITARQVEIVANMFTEMNTRVSDEASCDVEYVQLGQGSFEQWEIEEMYAIQEGNQ